MNSIIRHIQYLIVHHDCVVVPGFGAFVAQFSPARISGRGAAIEPPRRDISFNSALIHDDGMLISSVARKECVAYDVARRIVLQDVEAMRRMLEASGSLDMPRVGSFSLNGEGDFRFTPAVGGVETLMYAGLPVIEFLPVVSHDADDVDYDLIIRNASRRMLRVRRVAMSVARYAAAAALLVGVGLTVSTPVPVDGKVDHASLSFPSLSAPVSVSLTEASSEPVMVVADTLPIPAPTVSVPSVVEAADMLDADADRYSCFVVVASCASEREADRFIRSQSNGQSMKVLRCEDRYRVYVAAGNDYDAAFAYRVADSSFAARHPNAWVYKKKSV